MGVQGLQTLVNSHKEVLLLDLQFSQRKLVIDGLNLTYLLYFSSGLDQNYGGDYGALEDLVEQFVAVLRDCGISPYVVIDGGQDPSNTKLETVNKRAQDRIRRADLAARGGQREQVLPALTREVVRQTLTRLQVPVAMCYAEADQEIAALARDCPVLSNDSDFFIYDLPGGLLPSQHFRWQEVRRGSSGCSIPCKIYHSSSFCIRFGIKLHLLPAFSALAGNDYVKLQRERGGSISWDRFSRDGTSRTSRLEGLLHWLSGFQDHEEAFKEVLKLQGELSREEEKEVLQALMVGMKEYQLPASSLKRFFLHGIAPPLPAQDQGLVPSWTQLLLTQARLTSDVLDVLRVGWVGLSLPVDCAELPSASLTSRPLRQLLYGLLLPGPRRLNRVEERDREGLQLKFLPVTPIRTGKLHLQNLDQAELPQRLQLLLDALELTEDDVTRLPSQLRLPLAVTWFWLQRAEPQPDEALLQALLLGMSAGQHRRHRTDLRTGPVVRPQLDLDVGHSFNQWQFCLKDGIHLNQLLRFPLEEPQIARLYEGTQVHQLVRMFRSGQGLKSFLKSESSLDSLYQDLLKTIHRLRAKQTPSPQETLKGAESQQRRQQQRPLDDLNLEQLSLLQEDNEVDCSIQVQEDLSWEDQVYVPMRFRSKVRRNRSKDQVLTRKEESHGGTWV